jgi:hypothetical protein
LSLNWHYLTKAAGAIHTTPAIAAGVSDHVWKLEEIIALLEILKSEYPVEVLVDPHRMIG